MASNKDKLPHLVRIEAKRIQTFLFAVPRLREMLGANALLGDALRHSLPGLLSAPGHRPIQGLDYGDYPPPPFTGDPLLQAPARDDPKANFRNGILSRDGGHVHVLFPDRPGADAFIEDARAHLSKKLPGLRLQLDAQTLESDDQASRDPPPSAEPPQQFIDLPPFQVCRASGVGPACALDEETRKDPVPRFVSAASRAKAEAGKRFQQAQATGFQDIISLIRDQLPGHGDPTRAPMKLEHIAGPDGYLAVIHADGNGVGKRYQAWKKNDDAPADRIAREARGEHFFHHMRSAVRAGVIEALREVFTDEVLAKHGKLPYQLLMLGGDDLLMVCAPRYALPFVHAYAGALKDKKLPDKKSLSIGAGIAIASHKLPFHRLHAVAEALSASAKRAFLQTTGGDPVPPQRSVVDWTLVTSSWAEAPLEERRRNALVRYGTDEGKEEILALSAKPYFILDSGDLPPCSVTLDALLNAAEILDYDKSSAQGEPIPRSQLKDLVRDLRQGRRWAGLNYRELRGRLPESACDALDELHPDYAGSPWQDLSEGRYLTHLGDLIEVVEIPYLGRRKPSQSGQTAPTGTEQSHAA